MISTACSFDITLNWGCNLAAGYPVTEIIFEGDTLFQRIDQPIAWLNEQLAAMDEQTSEVGSLRRQLSYWQSIAPYVHEFAPRPLSAPCWGSRMDRLH